MLPLKPQVPKKIPAHWINNRWGQEWISTRAMLDYFKPPRGEEFCDAATKTHINDTPAYYYNYAFATVFKFQLHDYIARETVL